MRYLLYVLIFLAGSAVADALVITWQPPTQRTDGTAMTVDEIAAFTLQIDGTVVSDTIPGTDTSYQVSGLPPGRYCVEMSTTDTEGRTGPFSQAVCKNVNAPPGSPTVINVGVVP